MTRVSEDAAPTSRRQALAMAAGTGVALAGAALAGHALAAPAAVQPAAPNYPPIPRWPTEFKQLRPNVWAFIREGGNGIDNGSLSNAGLIVGPDNAMIVDALGPPIHAKEFQAAVRKATPKPVTRLVNTHHHRDHSNGDYLWEPAEIVATELTRKLMLEQGIPAHPYDTRPNWQAGMSELRLSLPTTTITGDVTYYYGDTVVQLIVPGWGHTAGDIMVYLPKEKILFSGDIGFFGVTPAPFSANIAGWFKTIDRVMAMDVETIVPGHGPVGGKKELADMAGFLRVMVVQIRRGYEQGLSAGAAAAAADIGRYEAWGNPERIPAMANRLYLEWNGVEPLDLDLPGQSQAQAEFAAIRAAKGKR